VTTPREGRRPWHERGAALPFIIIIVFFLSFVWILSLSRTTSEFKGVGSSRRATDQFYSADTALAVAYENKGTWLTDDFIQKIKDKDWDNAAVENLSMYDDNGDMLDTLAVVDAADERWGRLTFRPIQDEDEDKANEFNLPVQPHEVPPPAGSGYGMSFKVRRYGVNAISPDGSREIQAGVWVLGQ
jgi:hypothetical protein